MEPPYEFPSPQPSPERDPIVEIITHAIRDHGPVARANLRAQHRTEADIEEALALTWKSLWIRTAELRQESGSWGPTAESEATWLWQLPHILEVATNAANTVYRRRGTLRKHVAFAHELGDDYEPDLLSAPPADHGAGPDELDDELDADVAATFHRIPDWRNRAIVVLTIGYRVPVARVSELLGLTPNGVWSRKKRLMRELLGGPTLGPRDDPPLVAELFSGHGRSIPLAIADRPQPVIGPTGDLRLKLGFPTADDVDRDPKLRRIDALPDVVAIAVVGPQTPGATPEPLPPFAVPRSAIRPAAGGALIELDPASGVSLPPGHRLVDLALFEGGRLLLGPEGGARGR